MTVKNDASRQIVSIKSVIKEYSGILIFLITSITTIVSFILKGLEIYIQHCKYAALNIPTIFLEDSNSIKDFFPFIFCGIIFTVSVVAFSICYLIIQEHKAYFELRRKLQMNSLTKIQMFLISVFIFVMIFILVCFINLPSMQYISDFNAISKAVVLTMIVATESISADLISRTIKDIKNTKTDDPMCNCKKPKEMEDVEFCAIVNEYKDKRCIINYKVVLSIFILLLLLSGLFWISKDAQETIIKNNKEYQIVTMTDDSMVVLGMYEDKYIVSPATMDETTLYINNENQMLLSITDTEYTIKNFVEVDFKAGTLSEE